MEVYRVYLTRPGQGLGGVDSQVTVAADARWRGEEGRAEMKVYVGARVKCSLEQAGLYKSNVPHGLTMVTGA